MEKKTDEKIDKAGCQELLEFMSEERLELIKEAANEERKFNKKFEIVTYYIPLLVFMVLFSLGQSGKSSARCTSVSIYISLVLFKFVIAVIFVFLYHKFVGKIRIADRWRHWPHQ